LNLNLNSTVNMIFDEECVGLVAKRAS